MKKLSSLKIVQLSVFTVLTLACIYFLTQDEVKQFVFSSDLGPAGSGLPVPAAGFRLSQVQQAKLPRAL